jgi:hypothetical protein
MLRRNREIVIFNLSAIDLFCSGMGAVMVLMVLLMPYYRKQDPVVPPEPQPPPVAVVTPPAPPLPVPPVPAPPPPEPIPEPGIQVLSIDVVFVLDATASMDNELSAVGSGMKSIIQVLRRLSDEVSVGFVAFIDRAVPWTIPLAPVNRDALAGSGTEAPVDCSDRRCPHTPRRSPKIAKDGREVGERQRETQSPCCFHLIA